MQKSVKRPLDVNQLAKFTVDVATGEREASLEVGAINEFARAGGLKGGQLRADSLSPERLSETAKMAAKVRWSKKEK